MARSITFNGITRFTPGGITRINASALAQVTTTENGIVAIVGEAEGGAPGSEVGLVTTFDPSRAADIFRSGPIVDALNLAFQASNDPDVPGGASRVYIYKTNASVASTANLAAEDATEVVNSTATVGGTATALPDTVGLAAYTDDDDPRLVGKWLVINPNTAASEVRLITGYTATGNILTWADAATVNVATDPYIVLEAEVELVDVVGAAATTTNVPLLDAAMVANEHAGRWVYVQATASLSYVRQIVSNTTTDLVVSPALPAAPAAGVAYVEILANSIELTSKDWGEHTNGIKVDVSDGTGSTKVVTVTFEGDEEVSPELGGTAQLKVLFKGGTEIAATPLLAAAPSTASFVTTTGTALTPGAHDGQQVLINGEYTTITTNTATELNLSPALSAAPEVGDDVAIQTVTEAVLEVQGSAGAATSLTTTVTGAPGNDQTFAFSSGQTLRQLIDLINQDSNYEAVAGQAVNPDTTLVADFDFGPETSANIQVSTDLAVEGTTRNLMAVVDYLNDFSQYVEAARSSDTGSAVAGCCAPGETLDSVALAGGSRGISTNAYFDAGFDELLKVRCNSVVPLIDQDLVNEGYGSTATVASVAANLAGHVAEARGTAQDTAGERGGFQGFRGTKTEVIAQANSLNDQDVALVAQNVTTLNNLGTLQQFGPRMQAVIAASMRAGVNEIAEPLTHKLLRVSGLTQDSTWDPADISDANEMIINGVLFAETIDGVGTRWVRDLTTWVTDDNLAYSEGSVRDAVRYVAFGLRTTLVERFTGKKASPATIGTVKDTAASYLETARQDNIIVDSTDPVTGATVKAYHNLKVYSSGDTLRINVGIFPVPGINFQLNDIFLQLPTQSA